MDYEKKYKEALEVAKRKLCFDKAGMVDSFTPNDIYEIFPELKESDDERIRKALITAVSGAFKGNTLWHTDVTREEALAWLEKQKEFVSADFDDVWETADCEELTAPLEKYSKDAIKKICHAWYDKGIELERRNWLEKQGIQPRYNIGDVICDKSCTTLNKEAQPNMEIVDIKNGMYICNKGSFPVSQQDEYELVSKKIDLKPVDSVSNELREASLEHARNEMMSTTFPNNMTFEFAYNFEEGAKWQAARKSSWSKEDDYNIGMIESRLIDLLSYTREDNSLTKRRKNSIEEEVVGYINWLTSLKDRYTWKPSDEQMKALNYVVNLMASSGSIIENYYYIVFKDLREQLKKLRGEKQ